MELPLGSVCGGFLGGSPSDGASALGSELLPYFGNGYSSPVIVRQRLFKNQISVAQLTRSCQYG